MKKISTLDQKVFLVNFNQKLNWNKKTSGFIISSLTELPCCGAWTCLSRRINGKISMRISWHGDLHGFQHLLHCFYGTFVVLVPTTSQLHEEKKRGRWQTKAVKWKNISSPDLTTYVTNEESLKLAVLRRRSWSNQILYQLKDFWLFNKLSYSSSVSCRTLRQDVYMISPFPWPLVHKYTTLDSNFWTLSRGFHGKSRKLYAISPCRLIMRTRNKSYF